MQGQEQGCSCKRARMLVAPSGDLQNTQVPAASAAGQRLERLCNIITCGLSRELYKARMLAVEAVWGLGSSEQDRHSPQCDGCLSTSDSNGHAWYS